MNRDCDYDYIWLWLWLITGWRQHRWYDPGGYKHKYTINNYLIVSWQGMEGITKLANVGTVAMSSILSS